MEISTRQDRLVACLPAYQSRPGLCYPLISNSTEKDRWGMEKCGVLHFGGNNLRNGASYSLDQYRTLTARKSHLANRMEGYHLWVHTRTVSVRNMICMSHYLGSCRASWNLRWNTVCLCWVNYLLQFATRGLGSFQIQTPWAEELVLRLLKVEKWSTLGLKVLSLGLEEKVLTFSIPWYTLMHILL